MMTKIRAAFGVDVPLSLLFESPSVAGMAEGLAILESEEETPSQLLLKARLVLVEEGRESPKL